MNWLMLSHMTKQIIIICYNRTVINVVNKKVFMDPTYEYCSARFLDLWVRKEQDVYKAMQKPDSESIRKALTHFRVARSFAGIARPEVGNGVALLLTEYSKDITPETAPGRVSDLAKSSKFGNEFQQNISAASKLLWMCHRAPFVIYDSRALRALQRENFTLKSGNYHAYYHAWRSAYESQVKRVRAAVDRLPVFVQFTVFGEHGKEELRAMVQQDWFAERVFDQYLWLKGGEA